MNALTKLNTTDPRKKKLYTTLSPCALCANLIVNGGIDEVIYLNVYDEGVIRTIQSHGIVVRRI
jgi:deoxycytidylate deaminase